MKKYILLLILFFALSCETKTYDSRVKKPAVREIAVDNWKLNDSAIKNHLYLYVYDTLFQKKIDSITIKNWREEDRRIDYSGEAKSIIIYPDEPLYSDRNYRLVIDDTLQYDISEIKWVDRYVRSMLRGFIITSFSSYKVNDELIKLGNYKYPGGAAVYIDKNLGKPVKK